jgi:hypothetical protein
MEFLCVFVYLSRTDYKSFANVAKFKHLLMNDNNGKKLHHNYRRHTS